MVREYCVRLLRGSSASAPDAIQAASANIATMRFPTDSSINTGDTTERFPVFETRDKPVLDIIILNARGGMRAYGV